MFTAKLCWTCAMLCCECCALLYMCCAVIYNEAFWCSCNALHPDCGVFCCCCKCFSEMLRCISLVCCIAHKLHHCATPSAACICFLVNTYIDCNASSYGRCSCNSGCFLRLHCNSSDNALDAYYHNKTTCHSAHYIRGTWLCM